MKKNNEIDLGVAGKSSEVTPQCASVSSTKSRKQRRRVVASMAAVAGASATLPTKWTKPIVDHALLPAHAQTSELVTSATTLVTTISQGFDVCQDNRLRTSFFEFTFSPGTSPGTTSTNMEVTSNDVGYILCTDPFGGTTGFTFGSVLTFNSTSASYVITEGLTASSISTLVPSGGTFSTNAMTFTTNVVVTTAI